MASNGQIEHFDVRNITARIRQLAIKWNGEIRPSKTRTAGHEWKQRLKNKFVFLTQFEGAEPSKKKRKWREDLLRAAKETVSEICPNWASERPDHAAYELIMRETNKAKNPRQDWLLEKAYAWLKSPPPEIERMSWYPAHAIQVAHQLFLNGGGKFESFMKYLEKQKHPAIKALIQAHAATMTATMNVINLSDLEEESGHISFNEAGSNIEIHYTTQRASFPQLASEDELVETQHNIHCQTEANSRTANKYKIWTTRSGKQFSKCQNNPRHDELLEWKLFTSTGGHKGYRFTCLKCKSDNAISAPKKRWPCCEWTRCPVESCKALYKYNSGAKNFRTVEKHFQKTLAGSKNLVATEGGFDSDQTAGSAHADSAKRTECRTIRGVGMSAAFIEAEAPDAVESDPQRWPTSPLSFDEHLTSTKDICADSADILDAMLVDDEEEMEGAQSTQLTPQLSPNESPRLAPIGDGRVTVPENKVSHLTMQVPTPKDSMPQLEAARAQVMQQKNHIPSVEQKRASQSPGLDQHEQATRRLSLSEAPLRVGHKVRVVNAAKPLVWYTVRGFRDDEVILDRGALRQVRAGAMLERRGGCAVAIVLERNPAAGNPSDVYAHNLSSSQLMDYLHNITGTSKTQAADDTREDCSRDNYDSFSTGSDDDSDSDSDGMIIEELEEAEEVKPNYSVVAPVAKLQRAQCERDAMVDQIAKLKEQIRVRDMRTCSDRNVMIEEITGLRDKTKVCELEIEDLKKQLQKYQQNEREKRAHPPQWVQQLKRENKDLVQEICARNQELATEKARSQKLSQSHLQKIKVLHHLLRKSEAQRGILTRQNTRLHEQRTQSQAQRRQHETDIQQMKAEMQQMQDQLKDRDTIIERLEAKNYELQRVVNAKKIYESRTVVVDYNEEFDDGSGIKLDSLEKQLQSTISEMEMQRSDSCLETEMPKYSEEFNETAHGFPDAGNDESSDDCVAISSEPHDTDGSTDVRLTEISTTATADQSAAAMASAAEMPSPPMSPRKRRATAGYNREDAAPAAKKSAVTIMRGIKQEISEPDKPKPHGMSGSLTKNVERENSREVMCVKGDSLLKTDVSQHLVQVPEARAVVVLHVHCIYGEPRRSHSFCIDNRQGILVAGAHTLPDNLDELTAIVVHIYNTERNCFEAFFVAEPLAGGVSATFQNGGMDLALLRITHHYDSKALDRHGVPVSDPSSIAQRLCALPIGTSGYEPRNQVSVIRYPIIEADSSRGCKPKCGRVVACVGSRLHLDLTELQDGDSGALVINGAGEAIAFLMGRPPDRQHRACWCVKTSSGSTGWSTPDNSVYYAQLLCAEEPQAFCKEALLSNNLSLSLSVDVSVPWGEYKIKQRVLKLERIQGLESAHKQVVLKFIHLVKDVLNHRRRTDTRQNDEPRSKEIARTVGDTVAKFEATRVDAAVWNELGNDSPKSVFHTIGGITRRSNVGMEDSMILAKKRKLCIVNSEPKPLEALGNAEATYTSVAIGAKSDHKAPDTLELFPEQVDKVAVCNKSNVLKPDIASKMNNDDATHDVEVALDYKRERLQRANEMLVEMLIKERESISKAQKAHEEAVARLEQERSRIEQERTRLDRERQAIHAARKANEAEALSLANARKFLKYAVQKAESDPARIKQNPGSGSDVSVTEEEELLVTVNTSITQNAERMTVLVSEPKLEKCRGRVSLSFVVCTNPGEFKVKRKFSDFQWLYQVLCARYTCMAVLTLPDQKQIQAALKMLAKNKNKNSTKTQLQCSNQSTVELHLQMINIFFETLLRFSYVKDDPSLKAFLEMRDRKKFENDQEICSFKKGKFSREEARRSFYQHMLGTSVYKKILVVETKRLSDLNLEDDGIIPKSVSALAPALWDLCFLTTLNLTENAIGPEGARILAPALKRLSHLTQLELRGNGIGAKGVSALAPALRDLSFLTILNLDENAIGAEGAQTLAPALIHLSNLTVLRLRENGIGSKGVEALAAALGSLRKLTRLSLAKNDIDAVGCSLLAPELTRLIHLESLCLCGNNICSKGAATLASAIGNLRYMTKLNLGDNKIGAEGVQALMPALERLTRLSELDLHGNNLGVEGVRNLYSAAFSGLTTLFLHDNDIEDDDVAVLKSTLENLRQFRLER